MNRNTEAHFSSLPHVRVGRSRFDRSHQHKTTFNAGRLIPIFVDEVLPGDTFQLDTSLVCRMSTPIFPVMDNCYLDLYYFFVPNRLVWSHWEEFNGENKVGPWKQTVEYRVPYLDYIPDAQIKKVPVGSIGDYFGIPQSPLGYGQPNSYVTTNKISVLPFRAYSLIWNEWFRDENLQSPVLIKKENSSWSEWCSKTATSMPEWSVENGVCSAPAPVCKYHDYFTSALPEPQKGDPVSLPLALPGNTALETQFPVVTGATFSVNTNRPGMSLIPKTPLASGSRVLTTSSGSGGSTAVLMANSVDPSTNGVNVFPDNLYANLSGLQLNAVTINSLRQAFQLQKLYEKDARGGTRYKEILLSHFGVNTGDARLQRPEYLGGKRIPVSVSQVLQTSSTDTTSPQGNAAAYSLTVDKSGSFTRSFVEHGYIIGLACVRQEHTYQQGIEKFWTRATRFDFYWPVFANIGEQPIFNREIYAQGSQADNEVFGYQEAWADYRYKPSRTSGLFRSGVQGSLDSWHYGDYYSRLPILGPDWIKESDVSINRTLAVPSKNNEPIQFLADFYFDLKCTRPMPLYSVPGLVDHH